MTDRHLLKALAEALVPLLQQALALLHLEQSLIQPLHLSLEAGHAAVRLGDLGATNRKVTLYYMSCSAGTDLSLLQWWKHWLKGELCSFIGSLQFYLATSPAVKLLIKASQRALVHILTVSVSANMIERGPDEVHTMHSLNNVPCEQ